MEYIRLFERTILGWLKDVPHLPRGVRRWIGDNIWWLTVVGAIIFGLVTLSLLGSLYTSISIIGTPQQTYFASSNFIGIAIVNAAISLVFVGITTLLMAKAVTPLREKQKKGWVLLYFSWILWVLFVIISSILTLNLFSIVGNLVLGFALAIIGMYFLFEIHGEFAHVEKSRGVIDGEKVDK